MAWGGRDAAWAAANGRDPVEHDGRDAHKELARERDAAQTYLIRMEWQVPRETALYKKFYSKLMTGNYVASLMRWLGPKVLAIYII